ncbi:hypothetical protein A3H90_02065 [Candidatus Peribacteria bacterium RIFCSPLOWO2_02_FULL_55_36]|nr:MAG: hypothetical protein A2789_01970 [Candidatus Peribacteria bacterium RIFCSPHIGHO2_01_FULL_54_22]OGJ62331.1 MAG: hypothetical protein A3D12_02225 [Candidatus Peribacteria bacterium RIFCSPHIGHO2_02_FULL_55_24]OGJ67700.1 MAG: hypothetical protein A2947_03205 [Candidatus Peribacteria bacterium RIFCSPLOWO2_01_FULL_54_110]OGJ68913.1 MAG: hypothetical protein A3H90_02065 [Candidatus Peribacteria bacterium RIFCSPLOWO2_02_FULL_55_36]
MNIVWQQRLASHLKKAKKPLLVLLGPTASGKTVFSIEVAKWVNSLPHAPHPNPLPRGEWTQAEIINADSRQLYKYMDIGTAKITTEEMEDIPHHLFSILDPKEKVTVGWYKQTAERTIDDVLSRGNIPILVGGSMLYISAVTDGYVFTGKGGKHVVPVPYDILILGLSRPRSELVQRIGERTSHLLQNGWIIEVEYLLTHGYAVHDLGMKSHGYREIAEWILDWKNAEKLPVLTEQINAATRQYAKRQMTWWKRDERIQWIPCTSLPP